jgi:C-terminal processing protease CtpA/Prc
VIAGSPAAAAGIAPGSKLIAVNSRKFDPDILRDALKGGKASGTGIELLISNGDFFKTYALQYHDGEKYVHMVRDDSKPDVLSEIIKAIAK